MFNLATLQGEMYGFAAMIMMMWAVWGSHDGKSAAVRGYAGGLRLLEGEALGCRRQHNFEARTWVTLPVAAHLFLNHCLDKTRP